jgi:uncharacterized membrane protein (UPF0127 family)
MFNLKNILIVTAVFLLSTVFVYSYKLYSANPDSQFGKKTQEIKTPYVMIGETNVNLQLAKSYEEKDKGLGGRESLGENEGMLFVFTRKNIPTFWMRGMLIPLDIIWISDDTIVDIDRNIAPPEPDTSIYNLPKYSPSEPVDYVLEVNAGFSDEHGVKKGDLVEFFNL